MAILIRGVRSLFISNGSWALGCLAITIGFFGWVSSAHATIFFTPSPFGDFFDSYTAGELVGQGFWSGTASAWGVTNAFCYSGACVSSMGTDGAVVKAGTEDQTGQFYVRFLVASDLAPGTYATVGFGSDAVAGQSAMRIEADGPGAVRVVDGGGLVIASGLSVGQWHRLSYDWNMSSGYCGFGAGVDGSYDMTHPDAGDTSNCFGGVYAQGVIGSMQFSAHGLVPGQVLFDDIENGAEVTSCMGFCATPPTVLTVAALSQSRRGAQVPAGATFLGDDIRFSATTNSTRQLQLEVELKPVGDVFNGKKTQLSTTSADGTFTLVVHDLVPLAQQYTRDGNMLGYHWRARVVDATTGDTSDWKEFGDGTSPDFTAKVVPLWTQVSSNYPKASEDWATRDYASSVDHDCGDKNAAYKATIGTCGCLITSFVMLSHYYGIEQGTDGSDVTPLTFNNWLSAHKGYVTVQHGGTLSENLLDFNAARKYFGVEQNGKTYSWLQYHTDPATHSIKITDRGAIGDYLTALEPNIFFNSAAGHFFVATGKVADTYTIKDPYFYNTQTLSDTTNRANHVHAYNNTFAYAIVPTKLGTPKVVQGYATLYLASPAELLVIDPQGRRVGKDPRTGTTYTEVPEASYEVSDPIATSEDAVVPGSVDQTKILTLPTLEDGAYTVEVIGTGSGTYQLTSVVSGDTGIPASKVFVASTTPGAVVDYTMMLTNQTVTLTTDEVLKTLVTTIEQANLKAVSKALLAHVQNIKRAYAKDKPSLQTMIGAMSWQVRVLRGTQIPPTTADVLLALLSALQ